MIPTFSQFYNQKIKLQPMPIGQPQVQKIILNKNNVKLQYYFSAENQYGYKISFIVHINAPASDNSNYNQTRASSIDMDSLKQSILDNLDQSDLKYMMMANYSTNKTEFYFNWEKWINDAFKNIEVKKHLSIFDRAVKLGVPLPRMILSNSSRIYFSKFLQNKIKNYIIKKRLENKLLIPILPKEILNKLRSIIYNIFDYEYDIQFNMFYIKLKSTFVIGITMLLSSTIKDAKKQKINFNDPKYFDASVKNNLKNNFKDWDKIFGVKLI
jgi:hypothetical protein